MLTLIKNATLVNEGEIYCSDVLIENQKITSISPKIAIKADQIINAKGLHLLPGVIDDQVHFREPGLTHKANIYTESKAAIAGGITSFMEMPNTYPQCLTQKLLEEKFLIASKKSFANYSFFMGASNENLEEVLKTNPKNVGAIKIFMGSSTGNMLVDNKNVLEKIFSKSRMLIAVHCEDESIIKENIIKIKEKYGEEVPISKHPYIRSAEACFKSSAMAIELAKKYNTRLHVFHISTEKELELFDNNLPLKDKKITSEVCIHHLWFDENDYHKKGALIKWNPAVKKTSDKNALLRGLLDNKLDVIATDHAPHTIEDKETTFNDAEFGMIGLESCFGAVNKVLVKQNGMSLKSLIEKLTVNPRKVMNLDQDLFSVGCKAQITVFDPNEKWAFSNEHIFSKSSNSPFLGKELIGRVKYVVSKNQFFSI